MIEKILETLFRWYEAYQNRESERTFGAARAGDWQEWRAQFIKKFCELCLKTGIPLELHHVRPFHKFRHLEKDPNNVVTLCRSCHLKFGHLGSFRSWNEQIKKHIELFANLIKNRP